MPIITVQKSIHVNVSPQAAFDKLMDFNHWSPWSPWTIAEKGVKITVNEDNKHYHWKGDLVGEGEMRIVGSKINESLDIDLTFIKPFKSKAKVGFFFEAEGDGAKLTWTLDNKMPFFMFFMKDLMTNMIGMDFDRGLKMLKEYLEEGEVHSNLDFVGESKLDATTYLGVKTTSTMDGISDAMGRDFSKLYEAVHKGGLEAGDGAFSIYHKFDMKKQVTEYTAAVALNSTPANVPDGFFIAELPAKKTFVVKHTGPYHHIGNAWTAVMMRDRAKKFKKDKNFHPVELYLNSPENTAPKDLITEIHMGMK